MNPIQLCRAINDAVTVGPPADEAEALKRTYATTWMVVYLYSLGLAKPTKAALPRLASLWKATQDAMTREVQKAAAR